MIYTKIVETPVATILQALSGLNSSVPPDESMQRNRIFQTPKHLSMLLRVFT
jgi:hypothetical protein